MNGGIKTAIGQNKGGHALCQMHGDIGVLLIKPLQARYKPADCKGRGYGNINAGTVTGLPHQILAIMFQPVQRFAHLLGIAHPVGHQPHTIAGAFKQLHAKKCFQTRNLAANGPFGQGQFLGRAGKTGMAGGGLEGH